MNKFIISGNLTRDPELAYSTAGKAYTKFSVAVTRNFDREKTDFFNCTIFGKRAESLANYQRKGNKVLVEGEVQIENKDGKYYTNVIASNVEFLDSKKQSDNQTSNQPETRVTEDPFAGGTEIDDMEGLPF